MKKAYFRLSWSIQCYHCNSAVPGEEDCVLDPPPTKYLQECISNGVSLTPLNACVRSHHITPSNTNHKPDGEDVSYIIRKCTSSPREWEVEECNQGHCVYDTYCLTDGCNGANQHRPISFMVISVGVIMSILFIR